MLGRLSAAARAVAAAPVRRVALRPPVACTQIVTALSGVGCRSSGSQRCQLPSPWRMPARGVATAARLGAAPPSGDRSAAAQPAGAAPTSATPAAAPPRSSLDALVDTSTPPPGVQRLLSRYASIPPSRIRIFSIIAHIDHGKSTLADRLLEATGNIWPTRKGGGQVLDSLQVERQRGITVKAQSASMVFTRREVDSATGAAADVDYLINLIDTPGHVDFSYEVARSLAACQGALLLIDASQGVQAQTVANFNAAVAAGLTIIPVLTKIDLPTADPEPVLTALESVFHLNPDDALWTSAKSGAGISEVLPAIIDRLPPAGDDGRRSRPLRCLLFDSWFDTYRGVVCSVLVVEGVLRPGDVITACHSGDRFTVQEVGLMAPTKVAVGAAGGAGGGGGGGGRKLAGALSGDCEGGLGAGHIGYMIAGMKATKQAQVGDTFVSAAHPSPPLPGFAPAKPMVFASLYPVDSGDFAALVTAVDRLTLNDASVSVERESSSSLGFGLRCGFLGLLHMDVFHTRLQQEFDTPVIITAPMVRYQLQMVDGSTMMCERPGDFPLPHLVSRYLEPMAHVSIVTPSDFLSPLLSLMADRRGVQEDLVYVTQASASAAAAAATGSGVDGSSFDAAPAAGAGSGGSSGSGHVGPPAVSSGIVADDAPLTIDDDDESVGDDADDADDGDYDDDDGDSGGGDTGASDDDGGVGRRRPASSSGHSSSSGSSVTAKVVVSADKVALKYLVPWAEVVNNLYDAVKSVSAGYASLDWTPAAYAPADVVKVDVMVNQKPIDALCFVAHKDKALGEGRRVTAKLRSVIARQQFEVVIQAAIGGKVFARERLAPFRKDVLIKSGKTVGGGDHTRKEKLLSKQREGKKRMKTVGNVPLSQEAFHSIMTNKS